MRNIRYNERYPRSYNDGIDEIRGYFSGFEGVRGKNEEIDRPYVSPFSR